MHSQKFNVLIDSLRRLVRRDAAATIIKMMAKVHLADFAHAFAHLNSRERAKLFDLIYLNEVGKAVDILSHVEHDVALELLEGMVPSKASSVLENLDAEDAAAYLSDLPDEKSVRILELMKDQESDQVEEHLGYAEETAGRIMHTHFFALPEDTTVKEAVNALQESSEEIEMVFYLYVVDARGHLVGVVSLRQLIIVRPDKRLEEIMTTDVIRVTTDTDQEEVAKLTAKYDLLAVPVVDEANKLAGIITVDDVIDIMKEEATEDFFRLAGTSEDELYQQSSIRVARLRIPWLVAGLTGGLTSGWLLWHFRRSLEEVIALAAFVPIMMALGGNAGTQSASITVRSLALGRITFKNLVGVLWKELKVGSMMGIACGSVTGAVAYASFGHAYLGLVVGVSMIATIPAAALIGTLLPMLFKRIKIDPALASGPFVTAFNDIAGLSIYMLLSTSLLTLLK